MATKRQPSKQKRQTLNQRQRAALEARRANAATGSVAEGQVGNASSATPSPAGSSGGSLFSRLRGASATGKQIRTGGTTGGPPPGYRAAMSGLLAGVAAAVVGALLISIPVDASGEPIANAGAMAGEWTLSAWDFVQENPEATAQQVADGVEDWTPNGDEPYGKAYFPLSLGLVLPVIGAGIGLPGRLEARAGQGREPGHVRHPLRHPAQRPAAVRVLADGGRHRHRRLPGPQGGARSRGRRRGRRLAEPIEDEDLDDIIEVEEAIDEEEAIESDQLIEADVAR